MQFEYGYIVTGSAGVHLPEIKRWAAKNGYRLGKIFFGGGFCPANQDSQYMEDYHWRWEAWKNRGQFRCKHWCCDLIEVFSMTTRSQVDLFARTENKVKVVDDKVHFRVRVLVNYRVKQPILSQEENIYNHIFRFSFA